MEEINKLLGKLEARLTWASNKCRKHKEYPEGVQMMIVDNVEKCPLCERERLTKELEDEITAKAIEYEKNKKYNTLFTKSILQDETIAKARFENYITEEPEAKQNYETMKQYANDILNGQVFNILLFGPPGVGKSHLSYSLLYYVNEKTKDLACLFVDLDEMLRRIRDSFNNPESIYTEHYFTNLLSEVDLLVIDDLGAETGNETTDKQASDFTGRILRAVTNARQDKVTIITTNLPGSKLQQIYDHKTLSRLSKKRRAVVFKETTDKRSIDFGF